MKRFCVWLLALCLLPVAAWAEQKSGGYVEGIEYQRITPPVQTNVPPGKVQVVEAFWYGCPHCYHFEPYLQKWLQHKPANVVFERVPAQLNPGWSIGARVYYTEEALGILDKAHDAVFDAIHRDRTLLPDNPQAFAKFFADKFGIDQNKFMEVYNSFAVDVKVAHAKKLVQAYGINGVPSVIVAGKYRTDGSMAGGSFENLLKIVNYLVEKESAAKASSGQ